jgi:hypothetical protein
MVLFGDTTFADVTPTTMLPFLNVTVTVPLLLPPFFTVTVRTTVPPGATVVGLAVTALTVMMGFGGLI